MKKRQKDNLFVLIKSMSKSEKRHFKLYVGRLGANKNSKFLMLFNILDKMFIYNQLIVLENLKMSKERLSNYKQHLYKQILISLRLNPFHQSTKILIREQLDFATILYNKGIYGQSQRILNKAKNLAIITEEKNAINEIIELEKEILETYINSRINHVAGKLTSESNELASLNVISNSLSNLSLKLNSFFFKVGHVRNESEYEQIWSVFNRLETKFNNKQHGFKEGLMVLNSNILFGFLSQDFQLCYENSIIWVNLFYKNSEMINLYPILFVKGNNYLLESLFFIKKLSEFQEVLFEFENTVSNNAFLKYENAKSLSFLYINLHKINWHFLEGSFHQGLSMSLKTEGYFMRYANHPGEHYEVTFYYKFALLHFYVGNHKESINYLDKIISNDTLSIRVDLLCHARILNLIAHFEAGNDYNIELLIRSTHKFLLRTNNLNIVHNELVKLIKDLLEVYPQDQKKKFTAFYEKLKQYENHRYERIAFLYFDIISWVESKIENKLVSDVVRNKSLIQISQ